MLMKAYANAQIIAFLNGDRYREQVESDLNRFKESLKETGGFDKHSEEIYERTMEYIRNFKPRTV